MRDISSHEAWFRAYAERERALEKTDPSPMDLKLAHTMRVLANARSIVQQEAFDPFVERCSLLAALYHDIARFEQYLRYRTFKDRASVNHGRFGVRLIKETGCLAGEEQRMRRTVMAAVGLHNAFALPKNLPSAINTVVRVVRDSDKLDILKVIDEHLSTCRPYNPTVVLQLPDDPTLVSRAVIEKALHDGIASYSDLKSVNDFRLLLATWIEDMNFPSSRSAFIAQGHARHLLRDVPSEGAYAEARSYLLKKLTLS